MIQSKFEYDMTERAVFALEKIAKELKISNDSKFKDAIIFSEAELEDIYNTVWDADDSYKYALENEELTELETADYNARSTRANALMDKIYPRIKED